MSDSGRTSKPFVGSDRRSDILGKLAERARANPPAKTPEDIAARVAVAIHMQSKPPKDDKEEGSSNNDDSAPGDNDGVEDPNFKEHKDGKEAIKDSKDNRDNKDSKDEKDVPEKDTQKELKDYKDHKDDKELAEGNKEAYPAVPGGRRCGMRA
jgi:hypothetical protein